MARSMVASIAMALAVFDGGLAAYTASAQSADVEVTGPLHQIAPPAPNDLPTGSPPGPASEETPALETTRPQNGGGRFALSPVTDGYLRLDSHTGQVSFCSKRAVGWSCQVAAEDRSALENEIARLQEENTALKKELLARAPPSPGTKKGEPPIAGNEQRPFALPSDQNIERMKEMIEKTWRQLVEMINTLQKDMQKKN